jgi:hypothetical protein
MGRTRVHYLLGGLGVAGGVYYYSSLQEVPYTHRRHAIMFVSQKSELAMGEQVWEQVRSSGLSFLLVKTGRVRLMRGCVSSTEL